MEQAKISSSQGTQAAHATRAKAPAQQGTTDVSGDAAASGGFLALLAALDGGAQGVVIADAVGTDMDPAEIASDPAAVAMDAAAVAAWQGLLAPTTGDVATGLVRQADGGFRPDVLVNGASVGGLQVGGAVGTASALNEMAWGGVPQGLVAETAKLDASADLKDGQTPGTVAGFGRMLSRMQSAQAQRASAGVGADASMGVVAGGDSTQRLSSAHGVAIALAQAASERPAVGLHAAGAAVERGAGASSGGGLGVELSPLLAETALAGAASVRSAESASGGRAGEGHAGGGWSESGATSPLDTGNADNSAVFIDPGSAGAEEQVADQVAYWVNQKTQNAELTLNRDGQPVEVSVSLSGNEAHVTFRSDQAQTRELLDQSMAQLRDLLHSEGLVLSGMSVGTSAREGGGAQGGDSGQSRNRDGARQAQVLSSAPVGTASLARGGTGAERAVDIFV